MLGTPSVPLRSAGSQNVSSNKCYTPVAALAYSPSYRTGRKTMDTEQQTLHGCCVCHPKTMCRQLKSFNADHSKTSPKRRKSLETLFLFTTSHVFIFVIFSPASPSSSVTQIRGHQTGTPAPLPPLPITVRALILIALLVQHTPFYPPSTRVELCARTLLQALSPTMVFKVFHRP